MRTCTSRAGLGLLVTGAMVAGNAVANPAASSAVIAPGHAKVERVLARAVTEGGVPGILAEVRS
jgi:D-alanyl-D-alanine carboxypeptidase